MKRIVSAVSLALVLGMIATVVGAQFTSVTSFQVQNLSADEVSGQLQFYDASGSEVLAATVPFTITGNSSVLFTQGNNEDLPEGFSGSVVVSADKPIAAIGVQEATHGTTGNKYQGTYGGFSAEMASDLFYIPTVMKAFYGYTTEISVQNAGTANVDVTIAYDGGYTDSVTGLKPGAVHRFDNADTPSMPDAYIGSGVIAASGGNVVAVVNQNNVGVEEQQTYEGFSVAGSGTTLYTPVLMRGFYGFNTSVQVQNVDVTTTTVTMYYSEGFTSTQELGPGKGYLFTQENETRLPASWIGSAYIHSTGQNIVAVVNQQNTTSGKAASYNAVSGGATKYVGPNVMKAFYGFNTSVQVQNVSATPVTCRAAFSNGTHQDTPSTLAQYETYLFTQFNNDDLGASFIGSVELTCSGQTFVAVINQEGASGIGDTQMAYNALAGE